jgi:hypothetical protein
MAFLSTRKALGAMVSTLLVLSGCSSNGNDSGVPSAAPISQPMSRFGGENAAAPLSGQYKGTFTDNAYGTGKAKASYAAYKNGVGGTITVKYANATATADVGLVADGGSVDGTTVALSGSLYCTFSTTGTYSAKTRTLSGSYTAVYGCTGESGTFSLKHQCYYSGSGSADARPAFGVKSC